MSNCDLQLKFKPSFDLEIMPWLARNEKKMFLNILNEYMNECRLILYKDKNAYINEFGFCLYISRFQ